MLYPKTYLDMKVFCQMSVCNLWQSVQDQYSCYRKFLSKLFVRSNKTPAKGEDFRRENIIKLATQKFGTTHRIVTIDQIIKAIEDAFHISHSDLVGSTRKKKSWDRGKSVAI